MRKLIIVNSKLSQPKYLQIAQSVIDGIEKGTLKKGEQLPSINEVAAEVNIAKETIIRPMRRCGNRE